MAALNEPREIDGPLVSAYLARRALDYLVGFTLSPVLWRKLPGARSAGRVQSVALRLVCDREAEIEAFRSDEYWTIEATMATGKGEEFPARLYAIRRHDAEEARHQECRPGPRHQGRDRERRVHRRFRRQEGREAQSVRALRHLHACRWTPRASSGSRPSRRCRSPSASMKASTSAARPSASSPTCERTA